MSKNLKRASDWIQKQIDELNTERDALYEQSKALEERADAIGVQVAELMEVLEKLPIEENEKSKQQGAEVS